MVVWPSVSGRWSRGAERAHVLGCTPEQPSNDNGVAERPKAQLEGCLGWSEGVARKVVIPLRGVQAPDQGKLTREAFWASFVECLEVAVCNRVAFVLVRGSESGVGSADVSRSKAYRDNYASYSHRSSELL